MFLDAPKSVSSSIDSAVTWMEDNQLSLFLQRKTLKPEAEHGDEITRRFSMNKVGRMFAAAMQDRTIRLYDAQTCDEMQRVQDEHLTTSIDFSPRGDIVATGSVGRLVKLWDIKSGDLMGTLEGHDYPVLSLSFSPDGDKLVSGSGDTTLRIWDVDNLRFLREMKGHTLYVVSCDWDPTHDRIVSASIDSTIREWKASTGELLAEHDDHRTAVHQVLFNKEGSLMASASSDHSIILWDTEGKLDPQETLMGHNEEVRAISFSTNGKYLASGSSDKELYVWSMEDHSIQGQARTSGEIDGLEWYPNELAFISSDGTGAIIRWDVRELEAMLSPFQNLLDEIKANDDEGRKQEFIERFKEIQSQYDEEALRDKRLFYVMWQCKRELGLLKGKVRKRR
jgi:WD40 repeat protein